MGVFDIFRSSTKCAQTDTQLEDQIAEARKRAEESTRKLESQKGELEDAIEGVINAGAHASATLASLDPETFKRLQEKFAKG